MKQTKLGHRIGALLLAIVMVLSILPMTAFAADDDPVSETADVIETEAPETEAPETEAPETEAPETEAPETEAPETEPEETEAPETEPEETEAPETEPEETEEPETEPEETVEETTEETEEIMTLDLELLANLTVSQKPADGKTTDQPFGAGTGGSTNFRIPAMVTLKSGTIVAATDARWNTTGDGGGLDTIVSRSKDGGKTWNYTFANYLGDNGNTHNGASTCFIDPALAVDGNDTIYMLVDLWPNGIALNSANGTPKAGDNGFDDHGNLRLSNNGGDSYDYYLSDGKIYPYGSENDMGVTVDGYFNYTMNGVDTNLFFSNSPWQVYPTNYLYLTTSTDEGATWSEPALLDVKKSSEQSYLVGPGRGLVTSDGTIIFPCYEYTSGTQNASFIFSKDGGQTWDRTANALANAERYNGAAGEIYGGWSSEAQAVELTDGTIRMFFRNPWGKIHYVDAAATGNGYTWGKFASGPDAQSNCQLSAIAYSELIDGKQAVLVSFPTNPQARADGKIYIALDNGDGTMEWKYASNTISSSYAYSCLTELGDGGIALLAETDGGNGKETFKTYSIKDIAPAATVGGEPVDQLCDAATQVCVTAPGLEKLTVQSVAAKVPAGYTAAKTYAITLNDGDYHGAATVTIPYDARAFAGCTEFTGTVDGDTFPVTLADGKFVCEVPHFSEVTVAGRAANAEQKVVDINLFVGASRTLTDETGDYTQGWTGTGLDRTIADVTVAKGDTIPSGFVKGNAVTSITSGKQYLLINTRANKPLTNEQTNPGLLFDNDATITEKDVWTITTASASAGTYYVKDADGNFLNNGSATAGVGAQQDLKLSYISGNWRIYQNTNWYPAYLNDFQGTHIQAAGYSATGADTDIGSQWAIYQVEATAETGTTDITITGNSVGDTSVVIGNTTYNIHVTEKPEGGIPATPDNSPVVAGEGQGSGKIITKLNITAGVNFDLRLSSKYAGKQAAWVSDDESIITVDPNGTVHGVKAGTAHVLVTVDGMTYTIPVVVHPNGSGMDAGPATSTTQTVNIYISKIDKTDVFYSLSAGTTQTMSTDLVPTQEGEAFYLSYPNNYLIAFDFFGRPADGYALTRMSSTNSAGDYMALQDKNDPTKCDFYTKPGAAGANQISSFGAAQVQAMLKEALKLLCDGGMGFTRNTGDKGNIDSDLTFRSEKLPEITKDPIAIRRADGTEVTYTEGMTASVGDEVFFEVVVHKEAYQDSITYTGIKFTDDITGMTIYGDNRQPIRGNSVAFGTDFNGTGEVTKTYYVGHLVTEDDLDSNITNTAKLTHTYKAQYSSGSFAGEATAEAYIVATDFQPEDIVIDFGLEVTIDLSDDIHGKKVLQPNVKANYGDVTVDTVKETVTYIPKRVLTEPDTVTLTLLNESTGKVFNPTFKVHPASNVLYEAEDFMAAGSGWSRNNNNLLSQSEKNEACYGYDTAYASSTGTNGGYSITASGDGATSALTTSFRGNAFDLIGECGTDTGIAVLVVKNAAGKGKAVIVDTSFNDSNYSTISQVPWAHVVMGQVDDYEVEVTGYYRSETASRSTFGANGGGVSDTLYAIMDDLDAKGFGMGDVEFVYFDEASPLAQMNGAVMMSLNADNAAPRAAATRSSGGRIVVDAFRVYTETTNSAYVGGEKNLTYTNVMDEKVTYNNFVAYVEADANNQWTPAEYEANGGPQNEVYLANGQAIAFKTNGSVIQISARAVKGQTNMVNNGGQTRTITSNTEMYYTVNTSGGYVTISNTSGNLLALGNIKSNSSLQKMTAADIKMVCAMLSAPVEPEEPDEPETTAAPVYRLYNPFTLEHLLTTSESEFNDLGERGWIKEGIAWYAPEDGAPVYRLYNPYDDGHFYTMDEKERDECVEAGWLLDGVVTHSAAEEDGEPIYRLFNPYEEKNYHHYTASDSERDELVELGWLYEGIAWYAAKS